MKRLKKDKKLNIKKFDNFIFNSYTPQAELDYHLFGKLTAYDIEKIFNEFIEDSYIQRLKNLLIITGKGLVVKPLIKSLLSRNKYIESFNQAGHFNGQNGAFEVILID